MVAGEVCAWLPRSSGTHTKPAADHCSGLFFRLFSIFIRPARHLADFRISNFLTISAERAKFCIAYPTPGRLLVLHCTIYGIIIADPFDQYDRSLKQAVATLHKS
jgi:hypothetical protein